MWCRISSTGNVDTRRGNCVRIGVARRLAGTLGRLNLSGRNANCLGSRGNVDSDPCRCSHASAVHVPGNLPGHNGPRPLAVIAAKHNTDRATDPGARTVESDVSSSDSWSVGNYRPASGHIFAIMSRGPRWHRRLRPMKRRTNPAVNPDAPSRPSFLLAFAGAPVTSFR